MDGLRIVRDVALEDSGCVDVVRLIHLLQVVSVGAEPGSLILVVYGSSCIC